MVRKVESPFFKRIYNMDEYNHPHKYPLIDKPYIIDVELTNKCNLSCTFCDRQIMKREKGYMDFEVFKKMADQSAEIGVIGLRFIRWGEPYLHPEVFDAIKYAKEKGLIVHISSNGLLIDEEKAKKTIESGLDSIIFSMQGVDEKGYLEMRGNNKYGKDQYKKFVKNIEYLINLREKLNANNPFVQVTTTTLDETDEQIQSWKDFWNKKVDLATHTGATSLYRVRNERKVKPFLERAKFWKREWLCNEVIKKLAINWNGDFTACANDYDNFLILGNIKNMSIKKAWDSKRLNEIREILKRNNEEEIKEKIPFCSYCRNRF